eukprot:757067-Hanusia_phi.AAC.1
MGKERNGPRPLIEGGVLGNGGHGFEGVRGGAYREYDKLSTVPPGVPPWWGYHPYLPRAMGAESHPGRTELSGQDGRGGRDRTGQDRTGQDRTG